jgi:hypothetical protein
MGSAGFGMERTVVRLDGMDEKKDTEECEEEFDCFY